mgnify:CR=1 FL=1
MELWEPRIAFYHRLAVPTEHLSWYSIKGDAGLDHLGDFIRVGLGGHLLEVRPQFVCL